MSEDAFDRLVSASEAAKLLGMSTSSIFRRVQEGYLPAPIKLGPRCSRWRLSEIKAVIEKAELEARGYVSTAA
jgi:prophage regulatory protein